MDQFSDDDAQNAAKVASAAARLERAAERIEQATTDFVTALARERDESRIKLLPHLEAPAISVPPTVSLRPDPETIDTLRAIARAAATSASAASPNRWADRAVGVVEKALYILALVLIERLIHGGH